MPLRGSLPATPQIETEIEDTLGFFHQSGSSAGSEPEQTDSSTAKLVYQFFTKPEQRVAYIKSWGRGY